MDASWYRETATVRFNNPGYRSEEEFYRDVFERLGEAVAPFTGETRASIPDSTFSCTAQSFEAVLEENSEDLVSWLREYALSANITSRVTDPGLETDHLDITVNEGRPAKVENRVEDERSRIEVAQIETMIETEKLDTVPEPDSSIEKITSELSEPDSSIEEITSELPEPDNQVAAYFPPGELDTRFPREPVEEEERNSDARLEIGRKIADEVEVYTDWSKGDWQEKLKKGAGGLSTPEGELIIGALIYGTNLETGKKAKRDDARVQVQGDPGAMREIF